MVFRRLLGLSAVAIAMAGGTAFAQTADENRDADALAADMRILASNPLDIEALLVAGELTLKMGDNTAAAGFFTRVEKLDPLNARMKAGWGALMVRAERPGEALRRFQEAESRGLDVRKFAADRGLAYDLIGEQERAQRDYRLVLRNAPDDEVTRRYALSLGISGRKKEALDLLDPLLRRSDRAAWRDRAFILAMSGDTAGAQKIADTMMSPGLGKGLSPFFERLPKLSPVDRAFAVTFGETRSTPERVLDARVVPALPTLGPDPYAPKAVAVAEPVKVRAPDESDGKRGKKKKRKDEQLAAAAPVPKPAPPPVEVAMNPPAYVAPRPSPTPVFVPSPPAPPPPSRVTLSMPPVSKAVAPPGRPPVTLAEAPKSTPAPTPLPPPVKVEAPKPEPRPVVVAPPPPPPALVKVEAPKPEPQPVVVAPPPSPLPTPTPEPVKADIPAEPVADQPSAAEAGVAPTPTARVSEDTVLAKIIAGITVPASELGVAPMPVKAAPPPPAPAAPKPVEPAPEPRAKTVETPKPAVTAPTKGRTSARPPAFPADDVAADTTSKAKPVRGGKNAKDDTTDTKPKTGKGAKDDTTDTATKAKSGKNAGNKDDDVTLDRNGCPIEPPKGKSGSTRGKAAPAPAAKGRSTASAKGKVPARCQTADAKKDKADASTKGDPARIWVQVAGGANEASLEKAWAAVKAKAPDLFRNRQGWTTPLRATNRVLTGPFKTDDEAQAFVNQLSKAGLSGFVFTSTKGQKIDRLGSK